MNQDQNTVPDQALLDYLTGNSDGSNLFDTNAGTNPTAAAATSPVITNSNGTSSVTSSGWSGFFQSLVPAAATAFNTATQASTVQAANAAKGTQVVATAKSNTTLYVIAGVVVVAIVGFLFLRKK
jgi:LPXTG-motif cell wall-anchored protein